MAVIIDGLYEHYKGKQYKVIGVARHSETLEKLVVYQALYGNRELWVRPYEMFCEKILVDGTKQDRFKYLGNELDSVCRVYIEFPDDIKQAFFENGIDFEKEVTQQIENAVVEYEKTEDNEHKKDVALVILTIGASVSAVLLCVAKILRVINERPREVKVIEKNSDGHVIKEETVLIEPSKASQKTDLDLEVGTNSIKFKISDETK